MNRSEPENKVFGILANTVFYLLIILMLWPLFRFAFIITHDGPSHIYNAGLIKQILSGNALTNDLLFLKKFPEPNWIGHFLLAIFSSFLSPSAAEKLFLALYIFLFPYFFRKTILKVNNKSATLAFLVIPFVFSNFFFLGVYNFLAGVTILFASLNVLLPQFENNSNKKYLHIVFFSLLLYFSHLLALLVFLFMIALAHLFTFSNGKTNKEKNNGSVFIRSSLPLLLSVTPSILLIAIFFINKIDLPAKDSVVSFSEMLNFLLTIPPLITLTYSPENIYALVVFGIIALLTIRWMVCFIRRKNVSEKSVRPFYQKYPYWLIAVLIMLMAFFFIPDEAATGGVVKFRFELFFYLFLIILLSLVPLNKFFGAGLILTISCWLILKLNYLLPLIKGLSDDTTMLMKTTSTMHDNSILLPLNYSSNWMHCNIFDYAGTGKNIIVLDNYEAITPHFPLEWKKDKNPVELIGGFLNSPPPLCADVSNYEVKTGHQIDYILVWQYQPLDDSCTKAIQLILDNNYQVVYSENESTKLYKHK